MNPKHTLAGQRGHPFLDFADFCQARPPAGTGVAPDKLEATITRREATQAAAQQTKGEMLPSDGSIHPGNARQFAGHTQTDRAVVAGVGERT